MQNSTSKVNTDAILIQDYKHTFKTFHGNVLKDLKKRYIAPNHAGVNENNPVALAFDAGQRAVVQRIINIVELEEQYVTDGPRPDDGESGPAITIDQRSTNNQPLPGPGEDLS